MSASTDMELKLVYNCDVLIVRSCPVPICIEFTCRTNSIKEKMKINKGFIIYTVHLFLCSLLKTQFFKIKKLILI